MSRMWNLTIRIGKVLWLSEPYSAGVQLGGGGGVGKGVSRALIWRLEQSVLILGKTLIAVIYGLNFLFPVQFLRVSWRKNRRKFFGTFFVML